MSSLTNSLLRLCLLIFFSGFLLSCAETRFVVHSAKELVRQSENVKKTPGTYKIGKPYKIQNTWYYPAENYNYVETGIASWYGPKFHGKRTANGETFDMNTLTAAHRTLPMPSIVRVTNLQNGRSLKLRVNDRGPFARGRVIDVSRRAAQLLGFKIQGTARVRVEIISEESQNIKYITQSREIPKIDQIKMISTANQPLKRKELNDHKFFSLRNNIPSSSSQNLKKYENSRPMQVEQFEKVIERKLFVQAGAFINYVKASKVRRKLSAFGAAWLAETKIGRQKFFRVRIGPLFSVANADSVLMQVISAGYTNARIVVD
tara:strand:- start:164 stop:1117 length:954 start_codon:yes stop_codon:yes gene_type:complete